MSLSSNEMPAATAASQPPTARLPRVVWGVAIGGAIGCVVAVAGHGPLILAAITATAVVAFAVANEDFGVAVLTFVTYTRVSDNAIAQLGAPSLAQPLILLLLFVALLRVRYGRRPPPVLALALLSIIAYLLVGLSSITYAADPTATQTTLGNLARDALVALLVVMLLRSERGWRWTVGALLTAGMLVATLSLYQYATGSFGSTFLGLAQASRENIAGELQGYRLGGPIGDPNYFCQVLLVVIPLGVTQALHGRRRELRVLAVATTVIVILTAVFTYSRGGAIAGMVLLALIAWHYRVRPRYLVAAALIALLAVPLLPPGYASRLGTLTSGAVGASGDPSDYSLADRQRVLVAGVKMIGDHPLLGVGLGNFVVREPDYVGSANMYSPRQGVPAHNLYIEVAAETGSVGLLAFAAVVIAAFRSLNGAIRTSNARGERRLAESLWAFRTGLVAYFVAGAFIHAAYARYQWLLLGVAFGLGNLASTNVKRGQGGGLDRQGLRRPTPV